MPKGHPLFTTGKDYAAHSADQAHPVDFWYFCSGTLECNTLWLIYQLQSSLSCPVLSFSGSKLPYKMESYHDLSALLLTPNANVSTILEALTNNLRNVKSQFLIIDYLQLLVMSDICTPLEVIDLIYEIAKLTGASHLYLMVNNDEQFIGSDEGNNTAEFLLELTHRCNVVSSMEPLSTGSASDVTGVFRIVAGPKVAGLSLEDRVNESEMLYFVNPVGNASVKFFHR